MASRLIALLYSSILASLVTNPNYKILIDDRGKLHVIDNNKPVFTQAEFNEISQSAEKTTFHLYTRNNPQNGQQLFIDDLDSIKNSSWNPDHPTRLVTHGWRGDCEEDACFMIRDAYLSAGDYNVILIDWRDAAGYLWYWKSAESVPRVAQQIALLVNFLENNANLNPDMTTIVGFSLGAHVASLGARFVTSEIAEVVALDPASVAFESNGPGQRVDESDAVLVQVIHTTNSLGMKTAVGTADFYPNGGEQQPGCGSKWTGMGCGHTRAYLYYVESITNPKGFRAGDVFMGGPLLDPNAHGTYTLQTASESPFALG